jgi:hypothetical protein
MRHIRAGDWVIGLDHLISARRDFPRHGGLRLHFIRGPAADLVGPAAAAVWAELCRLIPSLGEPEGSVGHGARRRPPHGE